MCGKSAHKTSQPGFSTCELRNSSSKQHVFPSGAGEICFPQMIHWFRTQDDILIRVWNHKTLSLDRSKCKAVGQREMQWYICTSSFSVLPQMEPLVDDLGSCAHFWVAPSKFLGSCKQSFLADCSCEHSHTVGFSRFPSVRLYNEVPKKTSIQYEGAGISIHRFEAHQEPLRKGLCSPATVQIHGLTIVDSDRYCPLFFFRTFISLSTIVSVTISTILHRVAGWQSV